MARDIDILMHRDGLIKAEYLRLRKKRHPIHNTQLHTEETIWKMLRIKFFVSEKTAENIVYNRVNYKQNDHETNH